jgi:hypothetical protein
MSNESSLGNRRREMPNVTENRAALRVTAGIGAPNAPMQFQRSRTAALPRKNPGQRLASAYFTPPSTACPNLKKTSVLSKTPVNNDAPRP